MFAKFWLKKRAVRVSGSNLEASRGGIEKTKSRAPQMLVAQLQFLGDRLVASQIGVLQVVEQAAVLADHDQQTTARAMIFFVGLQMVGQMVDAMREQRDLHIRRTGVFGVQLKLFNRLCLGFHIYERENLIERDCCVKPN